VKEQKWRALPSFSRRSREFISLGTGRPNDYTTCSLKNGGDSAAIRERGGKELQFNKGRGKNGGTSYSPRKPQKWKRGKHNDFREGDEVDD